MVIWTLAVKDFRLLLRDRRAMVILLAMPVIFILILGLSLGEGFGQKPDNRLRVSIVDLDQGPADPQRGSLDGEPWSRVVLRDLAETGGIRVEIIGSTDEAQRFVRTGKRSAVLVLGPEFSNQVARCSFLSDGINPFYRDGVKLSALDAELDKDPTQEAGAAIIEQVAQVSLLRVVMPWMIGRAFEKLSEPQFIELLGKAVRLPVPKGAEFLFFLKKIKLQDGKASLNDALRVAAPDDQALKAYQDKVGEGVQKALQDQFRNYNLTGKTWAALTRSESRHGGGAAVVRYVDEDGNGLLKRGAVRYQILVPSYTVMFAFFLVLTAGWLFVSERRQGTLKRLRAAPLSRSQILLGKVLPCFGLSLVQGVFLLAAGKLVFNMSWGAEPAWLLPVVCTTSLAAMGMALLVATLARTETQVAIYGTLLVLVLAGISGCLMPRDLMPDEMKQLSRFTPHAWALDAYAQLLTSPAPNLEVVATACGVLTAFGLGSLVLAWCFLKLDC